MYAGGAEEPPPTGAGGIAGRGILRLQVEAGRGIIKLGVAAARILCADRIPYFVESSRLQPGMTEMGRVQTGVGESS